MIEKVEGIVINEKAYGETSKIINVITKEYGIIADIINPFKSIIKDINKISYAVYILELSEQVVKQTNQNIFDLMLSGLIKINEGYDPLIIMNIIELKYLDYLGVMPVLDRCSVCGSTNNIVTLSSDKGGYVCKNCYSTEKIISEKAIKLIRLFYYVDISKISKLEIGDVSKKEINDFLDMYYDRYTGLYLRSKTFLKNLEKV